MISGAKLFCFWDTENWYDFYCQIHAEFYHYAKMDMPTLVG